MSLQAYEIGHLSISFTLFVANIVYKNISSWKMLNWFSSVFKKSIPDATTPTFQEVGGITQPPYFFVKDIHFSHAIKIFIYW